MRSIKDKIKQSFSRAASTYDSVSKIQNYISDKMINSIRKYRFNKILEIGCGTGNYTEKLVKLNGGADFVLIDFSKPMISIAKNKLAKYKDRIKFLTLDAEEISKDCFPDIGFDLVTSNSTFQWFLDLEKTIGNIYNLLQRRGVFLFSFFGNETYKELNCSIKRYYDIENINIPAENFPAKLWVKNMLKPYFGGIKIKDYKIEKEYNNLFDLLLKIKRSGEYGFGLNRRITINRKSIREIEKIYLEKFKRIVATYHFNIIFSFKL